MRAGGDRDRVVVVGAGPAGISTALFLAAAEPSLADRIEVLELATLPREKFCAGAVGGRADLALASIGVRVDVPAVRVDGMSLRFAGGTAQRSIGDIGRVVRRVAFDHELVRQARLRGITVREGVRVTGVSARADGVAVHTDRGEVEAALVVGADGVRSVVRRALGLGPGALRAQVVEVDTELTSGDDPGRLVFDLRDRGLVGYAWDFPTPLDGRTLACRGVYDLDWAAAPAIDVKTRLVEHLLARGLSPEGRSFKRYVVRGLDLHRPLSAPRVLLVGEAAGVDPLLGEGIAQAVAYGALAGPYLAARWRAGRLDFADWAATFRRSSTGIDLAARTAAVTLVRAPAVRKLLEEAVISGPAILDLTTALFAGRRPPLARASVGAFASLRHLARRPADDWRAALRALPAIAHEVLG